MNNKVLLLVAAVFAVGGLLVYKGLERRKPVVHLVNVLDKEFYDDCHIPGSIQLDMDHVGAFVASANRNDTYVVYCANYACTASGMVAKELVEKGFKNVYAYEAGIADWYTHGYPCVGACTETYLKSPNQPIESGEQAHSYKTITTVELKKLLDDVHSCEHQGCACGHKH